MNDWSIAEKQRWTDFWQGEVGKKGLAYLEEMRDKSLENALSIASAPDSEPIIVRTVQQASGIDQVITMIKITSEPKKTR